MFDGMMTTKAMAATEVYTVSMLNFAIRDQLEGNFFYCLVEGEVSNAAFPQSGHIYFNLKDDGAVIKAVIWRSQAMLYRALIASGQKIRVTGKITVYAPRGEYQLIVSRVEEAGQGDLYLQFEALKKRLQAEGLFSPEFKKTVAKHPQKIGIVTSKTAAALQDVLNVFKAHRPDIPLVLYETRVQGENAGHEISAAIEKANYEAICDVLLLVRGGGSIEDLWVFNEEVVARAIFASDIPVITGVGHETDSTIADFVADLRAPTPSIAAKYSSQSKDELYQLLGEFAERISYLMSMKSRDYQQVFTALSHRLQVKEPKLQMQRFQGELAFLKALLREAVTVKLTDYDLRINRLQTRLDQKILIARWERAQQLLTELAKRLELAIRHQYQKREQFFVIQVEKLHLLSPLNTLLRGYSVVSNRRGTIIKSITDVSPDEALQMQVADGTIFAKVTGTQL